MGHEFLGIIGDTGAEVTGLKRGDLVLSPFTYADNTCCCCWWCRRGLQTSCPHGDRYGFDGVDGGQGEAARVPQAQAREPRPAFVAAAGYQGPLWSWTDNSTN